MTAATACEAAAFGVQEVMGAGVQITQAPLTDGGEGFCSILTNAANGFMESHTVCGPLGDDLEAPLGWCEIAPLPAAVQQTLNKQDGKVAIIEMAAAAGLEQVPVDRRHPRHCTTYGVGELIRIAVAEGADAILLGIGGSATSDLGLGLLEALGLHFKDPEGQAIERIVPENWPQVARITGSIEVPTPPIFIACDVDNPLLGARGAAAVYGPQKGLPADELDAFEAESARLATMLCQHFKQSDSTLKLPGSGAAGGIGFALNVACAGHYIAGFELVEAWLDLTRKINEADLILTGEGKIDRSSLNGKGPIALARAAHAADKPCILLAGCVESAAADQLHQDFPKAAALAITPEGCPLEQALAEGADNLKLTTAHVLRQTLT